MSRTKRNSLGEWRLSSIGGRDSLTGCWSLAALRVVTEPWRHLPVGLVHVDIPGLTWINDRLGHQAGDLLLCDISHRLARALPPEPDVVLARSGGDEFCILTTDLNTLEDLAQRAQEVLAIPRHCRAQSRVEDPDQVLEVNLSSYGLVTMTSQAGWDLDGLINDAVKGQNADRSASDRHATKPQMIEISNTD